MERAIGFEPMIYGFADRRLCPLGYARVPIWDFGLRIEKLNPKSAIRNPKSKIEMRTTGFEPAVSGLKDRRLNRLPTSSENAREKIRTFTKRFLRPLPLPLGYTRLLKLRNTNFKLQITNLVLIRNS
jgi:hypothetical protein